MDPKSWQAQNDLAFALYRSARDAEDITLYDKANVAIQHSFALSPGNYEARKLQVTVFLGKHEFDRAYKLAVELNKQVPDDIAGWALLVDVNVVRGNYAEAERAAQWILDLRAGSSLGFIKAAGLREAFGDPEGAAEFFAEGVRRTAQSDLDERAWLLTQEARQQLLLNKPELAEGLLKQALQLFPESQQALNGLARVSGAQGRYAEAAALLGQRYHAVPSPGNLYDWAEALESAGEKQQAAAHFAEFETKALAASNESYNWNRQLVFFYTDHNPKPNEALRLAEKELLVRRDSPALDAYAWALYANSKYSDAETQIEKALEPGVRDPMYFCHAAQIAEKAGATAAKARFASELTAFPAGSCTLGRARVAPVSGMQ